MDRLSTGLRRSSWLFSAGKSRLDRDRLVLDGARRGGRPDVQGGARSAAAAAAPVDLNPALVVFRPAVTAAGRLRGNLVHDGLEKLQLGHGDGSPRSLNSSSLGLNDGVQHHDAVGGQG